MTGTIGRLARALAVTTVVLGPAPDAASQEAGADAPHLTVDADWTEARVITQDGLDTWQWRDARGDWILAIRGVPTLDDDLRSLVWIAERGGFALRRVEDGALSTIRAVNAADGRRPALEGTLAGAPADADALAEELARVLPRIARHVGLGIDHRIETILMDDGLRPALDVLATYTSSAARLRGYSALARELDEPGGKRLARVLRAAARDLTSDLDMRAFLLEDMDLAFDRTVVTEALVEALATIGDQDVLASVLSDLATQTDDAQPRALVLVLELATERLTRDEPMATFLDAVSWLDLPTPAVRAAWRAALATVEADAPHARAAGEMLSIGDAPPAECVLVVRSIVEHVETESLRAQALRELHLDQLEDAGLADAVLEALQGFEDPDVLTDLLAALLVRDGGAGAAALLLHAAARVPADGRLASVLSAVPVASLHDGDVRTAYRALAESLWDEWARADALGRLP